MMFLCLVNDDRVPWVIIAWYCVILFHRFVHAVLHRLQDFRREAIPKWIMAICVIIMWYMFITEGWSHWHKFPVDDFRSGRHEHQSWRVCLRDTLRIWHKVNILFWLSFGSLFMSLMMRVFRGPERDTTARWVGGHQPLWQWIGGIF